MNNSVVWYGGANHMAPVEQFDYIYREYKQLIELIIRRSLGVDWSVN